jgi:hypothetical protein
MLQVIEVIRETMLVLTWLMCLLLYEVVLDETREDELLQTNLLDVDLNLCRAR